MPKKNILVGDDRKDAEGYLTEYFSETKSIPIFAKSPEDAQDGIRMLKPDFVFMNADWVDDGMKECLRVYREKQPAGRCFSLGPPKSADFKWSAQLEVPFDPKVFRKALFSEITLPAKIKLLVIDDEKGILDIFKDFFESQKDPLFEVVIAGNGLEGFKKMESLNPDCIVLDIKMPVRSGIEFYGDLNKSGREIPTIVFIDSTSPDEISKVRKFGIPSFVEKSGHQSSMPEMLWLVKKLIAFA